MEFTNLDPLARRRRAKQEERKNGSGQGAPRESGQTPRAPRRSTWGREASSAELSQTRRPGNPHADLVHNVLNPSSNYTQKNQGRRRWM